jgi:hypothetical protein
MRHATDGPNVTIRQAAVLLRLYDAARAQPWWWRCWRWRELARLRAAKTQAIAAATARIAALTSPSTEDSHA